MPRLPRFLNGLDWRWAVACVGAAGLLLCAGTAWAGAFWRSAHGDRGQLPRGCGTCHVGHGPTQTTMMPASQADTCFACHGEAAARSDAVQRRVLTATRTLPNVRADFQKLSRHPLSGILGAPRRSRVAVSGRGRFTGAVSSVNCTDCHDPHYDVSTSRGASRNFRSVKQIDNARGRSTPEYRLCYRCHGSSQATVNGLEDIRRRMSAGNPSYHPVEGMGRNRDVPSLIRPHTESSILACTDCHGSDQINGPRGPHGSIYEPILKANFDTTDGQAESTHRYALCYQCHSRGVLFSPSSFREHQSHVMDEKASCHTCHDSHGSVQYSHLIRFDTDVVRPNSKGQLRFDDLGNRRGSCSLSCHGKDHDNQTYR